MQSHHLDFMSVLISAAFCAKAKSPKDVLQMKYRVAKVVVVAFDSMLVTLRPRGPWYVNMLAASPGTWLLTAPPNSL